MSLANNAARGAAVTMAGQGLRFGVQIIAVAILSRLLDPSDFGVFAMVLSIVGVATVLGDFGLSMASIQSQTLNDAQRANLFWTNTALGILLSVIVYLVAQPIAVFYGEPRLAAITQVISITFLLNALTAQFRAEVSSKLRFKWLAAVETLAQVAGLGAGIYFAVVGAGYWALAYQQIAVAGVTLVGLAAGAQWWPGLPRRGASMRALYAFGANTLGVQVYTYITSNVDSVLIGRVWGADALGLYSRAYQIFRLPLQQIGAPMTKVALPILSRLQGDPRYDAYAQRAQLILGYAFGGLFFILAAVADPAIDILLGPGWEPAKPIFIVLAIGGVFQGIGFIYYWIFLSLAFTSLQLKWSLIGRTIMIGMMSVGVIWGPLGVAIGSSLGQAVIWLLNTVFAVKKTGVDRGPLLRIALRPLILFTPLVSVALFASFVLMRDWNVFAELAVLVAFILTYLGLAALLIGPIRRDVMLMWDVVRRLRS